MPAITLPDGSVRRFDGPVTGTTIAADIGPGLAKAALAMRVDGRLRDLSSVIDADAELRGLYAEITSGVPSSESKSRLVRELGEQGFMAKQRQDVDELRAAAQERAAQMVRNSAAELVKESPALTPPATAA